MENLPILKKERAQLRRVFSLACRDLDVLLKEPGVQKWTITSRLKQVEDKADRLFNVDSEIRKILLSKEDCEEGELDKEFDSIEAYRNELIEYQQKCESYFSSMENEVLNEAVGIEDSDSIFSVGSNKNSKRKFRLPKLELQKFDGNVRNWIGFWGQFRKIHEDEEIDTEDKFQYLLQATEQGSAARELVESFPPSGTNYAKAIDQMKSRFARDELLIEVYVRELLNLVLNQTTNKSGMNLVTLFDKLETQLRALESLGVTKDKYAAMLYPLVESSLPEEILKVWERHRSSHKIANTIASEEATNYNSSNDLQLLLEFLRAEVESEERINLARTSFLQGKGSRVSERGSSTKTAFLSNQTSSKARQRQGEDEFCTAATLYSGHPGKKTNTCIFCNKAHASQDCIKAQCISLEEKNDILKKNNCCYACLRPNHSIKKCRNFVKCIICGKRHYPIMCHELSTKKENQNKNANSIGQSTDNVLTNNNFAHEALLQTIAVKLLNGNKTRIVRALLDSGSQRSYILKDCAKEMNFKKVSEEILTQGVFGGQQLTPKTHNVYEITIQGVNNSRKFNFRVFDQLKICNFLPRLQNVSCFNSLCEKNIVLSDFGPNPPEISLLLGADVFGNLITGKMESLDNGLVAMETHVGWVLIGQIKESTSSLVTHSLLSNASIADLWSLDILGIKDSPETQKKEIYEENVLNNFNKTISRNTEGRYEVCLSWLEGHPFLINNFEAAEIRLKSTTKRLLNINKFDEYENVFQEWLELGIIEEVEEKDQGKIKYFLPHHAVVKESSATTKIRPVFDGSCKGRNGYSLNDCLYKGPNLIEMIPELLLKFRLGSIGVTADIKKAFLQISLSENDRNFLAFLWWEKGQQRKIKMYRHRRVVFGVSQSPFLLAATINFHLERAPVELKDTAEKLMNSFYVDNCVTSLNNESELEKFISDSKKLMSSAKFDLRGWTYNSGGIKDKEILSNVDICSDGNVVPVLGMLWDIKEDNIFCKIDILGHVGSIPKTKRGLLSVAQKIFDPIGFTSPTTIVPKFLLQKTWKLNLDWDQTLPDEIVKHFENWLKQVHWLQFCKLPRALSLFQKTEFTLHIFCDASKLAYATCIFIRAEENNMVTLQLLQAKSRIAPMKQITLPRLELLAAVIGVRLCQTIKKVEIFNQMKTFFWSDSMIVLTWIKTKAHWNTFVGNRIKEIRSCSSVYAWHHVPGEINPADLPSRGCSPKNLLESKWWEGPAWLKEPTENWPKSEIICLEEEVNKERRKSTVTILVKEDEVASQFLMYFSKYTQIIRMVSWILRFLNNSKTKSKKTGELTTEEVQKAEVCVLRIVQEESFGEEFKNSKDNVIRGLQIYRDENSLLRVKTRLVFREDSNDFKYPILLPSKHEIVCRLIEEQHRIFNHASTQTVLCIIREHFWVLKARKTIKEVISKCVVCKRQSQKPLETPFAPLPRNRIKNAKAFEVTGVDLAGPMYLKNKEKAWIVVFTCAIYRAVHLELVLSLSTDCFLMALRRFIARRGRVSVIYSDNGTNFVGANNLFAQINWDQISTFSTLRRIKWYFNPPTAAWWGGWWERIVRIIKELLRRNLGRSSLYYEELATILCDCEAVINSRPLTYVSEDSEELLPLTPSMFLQNIPSFEIPDLDSIDRKHLLKRYKYLQQLRDNLGQHFRSEYLANLADNGRRKNMKIRVGDVVLVGSDNAKRVKWPIGRITEIFPGRDNVSRVAKIKLSGSEVIRPFQRLYPLEVSSEEEFVNYNVANRQKEKENKSCGSIPESKKDEYKTKGGRIVKVPNRFQTVV